MYNVFGLLRIVLPVTCFIIILEWVKAKGNFIIRGNHVVLVYHFITMVLMCRHFVLHGEVKLRHLLINSSVIQTILAMQVLVLYLTHMFHVFPGTLVLLTWSCSTTHHHSLILLHHYANRWLCWQRDPCL
jgi:hypothetical protein